MPTADQPTRSALYVDFDNVFMALLRWDERAAYALGERPDAWLAWLERDAPERAPRRRVLVRRCYLNPGRAIDFPIHGPVTAYRATQNRRNRVFFSEFRANFVQAGFDVVDCPPVASLKNAADMRMALDIREALDHPTRFDEFIILSGDSDFLPALTRLRAHDRRITILAQDTAKQAYLAAADEVVGLADFAHRGMGGLPIAALDTTPQRDRLPSRVVAEPADHRAAALAWLREFLAGIPSGVVAMTAAGDALQRAFPGIKESRYAGAGTLGQLVQDAGDPGLAAYGPAHQRWLYDPRRHRPSIALLAGEDTPSPAGDDADVPEMVVAPAEDAAPEWAAVALEETGQEAEAAYAAQPLMAGPPPGTEQPELPPPQAPPAMDPAAREAFIAGTVAKVRDLLWGRRDIKDYPLDLPAFSGAEVGFVLRGITRCSPFGPQDLERAARTVAADGAGRGVHVSPREVVAIIRWLLRGKVSFREPMPPTAAMDLAEVLYNQVGRAVERAFGERVTALRPEERIDEEEWAALEVWITSGLNPP